MSRGRPRATHHSDRNREKRARVGRECAESADLPRECGTPSKAPTRRRRPGGRAVWSTRLLPRTSWAGERSGPAIQIASNVARLEMRIGVAKEIKSDEYRVALTPAGARELIQQGHDLLVEQGAGEGSAFPDSSYETEGAQIVPVDEVWSEVELLLKVKEPVHEEYGRLREGLVLFTYLHLAADEELTRALVDSGVSAVAYETVETPSRSLPLLAPMSEIAGRLSAQAGADFLEKPLGGRGLLLRAVP